jgi:hypothetical protein
MVLFATLAPSSAMAGDIVLESHVGARPADSEAVLGALITDLERYGFMGGPDSVGRIFESRRSRPGIGADKAALSELPTRVDVGLGAYVDAKYAVAADNFRKAVELADAAPAAVALDKTYSAQVLQARIGLALAMRRLGELTEAKRVMAEVVRAHLTSPPTRDLYGSEAIRLFDEVKKELAKSAPASLDVIAPPDVSIYLNEVLVGKGAFSRSDLPAGTYRVLTSREQVVGRIYSVTLKPGAKDQISVQWGLDSVLHTSPGWTGIVFPDDAARRRSQGVLAGEVARGVGQRGVVATVGFETVNSRPYVFGRAFESETGQPIAGRGGRIPLVAKTPIKDRLRELARSLAGQSDAIGVEPLDGPTTTDRRPAVDQAARETRPDTTGSRRLRWAGLAGTVATVGVGLSFAATTDRCFEENPDGSCGKIANTKAGSIGVLSAGVVMAGVTGYLWARTGPQAPEWSRGGVRWGIAAATVGALGTGVTLLTIDRSKYHRHGDWATPRYEYRPTLVVGGVATAVGTVGLGFTTYLLFHDSGRERLVTPTVDVSSEGASLGVGGRW